MSELVQSVIGDFGQWQLRNLVLLSLTRIPLVWHQLSIIFLAPNLDYKCNRVCDHCSNSSETMVDNNNSTFLQRGNNADQCEFYLGNETAGKKCDSWTYDRSVFSETVVTQWDLVCDRRHYADILQATFMAGGLLGDVLFGMLSDRFGRKKPLIVATTLQVACGTASAFQTSFPSYLLLRLLTSIATSGTMQSSFVICLEITGGKWRQVVAVLYSVPFSVGYSLLALVAFLLRDWHWLQLFISLPWLVLVPIYCWLVPESPKWLTAVGRTEEAVTVLKQAAAVNQLPAIPEDFCKQLQNKDGDKRTRSRANLLDLFRTRNMRKKTLCVYANWFVSGFCFFGLAQLIGRVDGNVFVNVMVTGLLQLPGKVACIFILDVCGRRRTLMASLLVTGVACLTVVVLPTQAPRWPGLVLSVVGMSGLSVSIPTLFLYSGELFPTVVRNNGIGSASMFSRLGSVLVPFVASLSARGVYWPPLCFGLVPLIGASLCACLPETVNTKLPHTLEDGENFGKQTDSSKTRGFTNEAFTVETTDL